MGTLFSGVGLVSGIDFSTIVNQLIAIEARPRDLLMRRIAELDAQRTAFLDISARILAMQSRISSLAEVTAFRAARATSSNSSVLTATVGQDVSSGSYSFTVRRLASTHQLISDGFRSRDAVLPSGTITIESAAARVDRATLLDELNGHAGVQRGRFRVIDGDGESAAIDLREAQTLADVVQAINEAGTAVTARIEGDRLVLADSTGRTFRVREEDGGHTAADLGFKPGNTSGTDEIVGAPIAYLSGATPLEALNDGNGVRRAAGGGDFHVSAAVEFDVDLSGILADSVRLERLNDGNGVRLGRIRITNRAGRTTEVDLSGLRTIGEVRQAINASGAGVTVTAASSRLVLADETEGAGTLKVEDLDGGAAAAGLGIAGSSTAGKINGRDVLRIDSLADVLAAVNFATGNELDGARAVEARISADGKRIEIVDLIGGTNELVLETRNDSHALLDLGLTPGSYGSGGATASGRRIASGLDTALLSTLNGGAGFAVRDGSGGTAILRITDATGRQADVDLGAAETLADVVSAIRAANLSIEVGTDANGTRLAIRNAEGVSGNISIEDAGAVDFAAQIGIAGANQDGTGIRSVNLQRQYVSETTRLEDLNAGLGVARGSIRIRDSAGGSATVDLARSDIRTLGDVIEAINDALPGKVRAAINDTGDGLLLEDLAGGTGRLTVEESGSSTARDLNILGEATDGRIDGSFELSLELSGAETLETVASRINELSRLARADVFNDGSAVNPYRLSVGSRAAGQRGELLIDAGGMGLEFATLSRATDALVIVGSQGGGGFAVRSSSNTIQDVVPGLTLNLVGADDEPVTVTVDRNFDAVVATIEGLVSDYNALMKRIADLTKYDEQTQTRGVLLGDGTAQAVQTRMTRIFTRTLTGSGGEIRRLSDIGIRMGEGAQLVFDRDKFVAALENQREDVERFFATDGTGLADVMKEALEALAGSDGLIKRQEQALNDQKGLFSERITFLNELLERKRQRLTDDFLRMERALAALQSQQASLASLAALAQAGRTGQDG